MDSEVQNILERYGIQRQTTVHENKTKQMFRDVLKNQPSTSSNNNIILFPFAYHTSHILNRLKLRFVPSSIRCTRPLKRVILCITFVYLLFFLRK